MRPRALAVLAVVVLGLLAFIWFFERDLPSTDERRERAEQAFSLEPDAVVEIEIARGEERLRLERVDGGTPGDEDAEAEWRLVEPLAARADGTAVGSFLDSLLELSRERTLEDFDAAAVGLAAPRATVRVADRGGSEETLRVGNEVPAASRMIVQRVGSAEALVVPSSIWSQIERATDEWRERKLFVGSRDEVESIAIAGAAAELRLARRDGDWWLAAPLEDRAAEDRVSGLLGAVVGLEVEDFLDPAAAPSEAELGLAPAWATLELGRGEGGEPFRLEIGAAAGGEAEDQELRYGRLEGQLFTFDAALDGALERTPEGWQSLEWSGLEVWEIDRLTVTRDGEATRFERAGGDWQRDGEKVPYNAVSDLLYAIDGLEPEGLAPAGGEAAGREVVTFQLEASGRSERLELLADGDGHLGTVEGRSFHLRLPAAGVEDLLAKLESARTAVVDEPTAEPAAADEP